LECSFIGGYERPEHDEKGSPLGVPPIPAKFVYDTIKKPSEFLPKLFTMSVGVCIIDLVNKTTNER
jgi:hypothetical protein